MTRKLRSSDALLLSAVTEAIAALGVAPEDSAASRLARAYAQEIDERNPEESVEVLDKLGPKLLATLDALGATPKSRGRVTKTAPVGESELERLRAARRA
jgi:hypothetical protein